MSNNDSKTKRKKKPRRLIHIIFSQKTTIILLLLAQFVFIFITFETLNENYAYVQAIFSIISISLVLFILNTGENPAYKLAWIIPLMAAPVFTTVLFIMLYNQFSTRYVRNLYARKCANTRAFLPQNKPLMEKIKGEDAEFYKLARYIDDRGGYPACENSSVEYFPLGEDKFQAMKRELKKAQKFIFLEYFIIDDGEMWGEILQILVERLKAGVEVKLLYDGMGSQFILPKKDIKLITDNGGKCLVFNKFHPMLSTIQNNRDHRKILVIDGNTAFNGGVNIADEYINKRVRFGHWKDNAVMIKGEAVWNFTMMFLQMWEVIAREVSEYDQYRPSNEIPENAEGYVIPYGDSPLDGENVGKLVYIDMINSAKDYIYITTPYLIPDNELVTALELAAKSGVEVRLIVPGIPDKAYVNCITKSYYKELMAVGVKIYEYDPGFIHAKTFLCDDKKAVVGTINLDYRSLYLHFECATYIYKNPCIKDIRADFEDLFANKCHLVTTEDFAKWSFFSKICAGILRTIAPLL